MTNETGFHLAARGSGKVRWHLFVDQVRRPQPTWKEPLPAAVEVWGADVGGRFRGNWRWATAFQTKVTSSSRTAELPLSRTSRRLRVELRLGRENQLRVRADFRQLEEGVGDDASRRRGLNSSALVQRRTGPLRWVAHVSRYRTDAYDTRLYEFEYTLPGAVSIRPLYGDGWRAYAMVRCQLGRFECSARYRHERRVGAEPRHEIGLQLDLLSAG